MIRTNERLMKILLLICLAPPASAQGTALETALRAIEPELVAADVAYIADPVMEGRTTPSAGLRATALFLRSRVERLGFEPGTPGSFFAPYNLTSRKINADASSLTFSSTSGTAELRFGDDYYLDRSSQLATLETVGTIVSVGKGSSTEFNRAALEGHWALYYSSKATTRRAMRRAREAGAIGLIVTRAPDSKQRTYAERYRGTTERLLRGSISGPARKGQRTAPQLPVVMLDPKGASALYEVVEGGVPAESGALEQVLIPAGTELAVTCTEQRIEASPELSVDNVAALWRGSDAELAAEVIVLSAHYDHLGTRRDGGVYAGADDNASGTAGLLAVADALANYGPLHRSVLLLWVSGEEKGLWGSYAWTLAPNLPQGLRPVANINIDMIGRNAPKILTITPTSEHEQFNPVADAAYELSASEGFPELASQDEDWNRSDHKNFADNLEIPVAFLSAGEHDDYHAITDTADKIDNDKIARVARLVVRMLDSLQSASL